MVEDAVQKASNHAPSASQLFCRLADNVKRSYLVKSRRVDPAQLIRQGFCAFVNKLFLEGKFEAFTGCKPGLDQFCTHFNLALENKEED